jgi:hypothetical protein
LPSLEPRSTAQRKNPRLVIFNIEGRPGSVQFFRTLFDKDAVPATLRLTGEFAEPRAKLTAEERKARRKAMTPAERLAQMEKRVAKMKAKLAAEQAAPAPASNQKPAPTTERPRVRNSGPRLAKGRR